MRLVVADDHALMVEGIRAALAGADDIEVVGVASDGAQVLPLVGRLRPDAVLLDLMLPRMDGLACLEAMRGRFPETKVVMLSAFDEPERIDDALRRGAAGYIVKGIDPRDLAPALRQVVAGTVVTAAGTSGDRVPSQAAARAGLTEREAAILRAAARGLSNRAIARELWVTEQTVKFHLTNVFRKLGVGNRTAAARAALALGLVANPAVERADRRERSNTAFQTYS